MVEETWPTGPLRAPKKTVGVWQSSVSWWTIPHSLRPDTSSISHLDKQQQQQQEQLVLSPFKDNINTNLSAADRLLQPKLRPLHTLLQTFGAIPYMYDGRRYQYILTWCSWPAAYTILTTIYMIILLVVAVIGLIPVMTGTMPLDNNSNVAALKLIGVILLLECVVNALGQLVSNIVFGRRGCRLLNSWHHLIASSQLDPTTGLMSTHIRQLVFLVLFWAANVTMAVLGRPSLVTQLLDGLTLVMLGQPSPHQMVRVWMCLVALHVFSVYKGGLFSFTSCCHLISNAFTAWNSRLAIAIDEVWNGRGGGLGQLVLIHHQLVSLVRETEAVFGPTLQCYFATTIVVLCAELYLLASRLGSTHHAAAEGAMAAGLLIVQTLAVFAQVSLAAAGVQEASEGSMDIVRRGLPYNCSDKDKFHREELTTSLTSSTIHISGGRYFIINRPFILTVVSAVATYFIVMLQLLQPHTQNQYQPTTTTLDSFNTTDNATFTTLDPLNLNTNTIDSNNYSITTMLNPTSDTSGYFENSTFPSIP
ncbi:hypothetical protein Pmani_030531 [Petrolisthes manimaculis]|uniref:Gustatory receptor n=1 Tax=Petrolisthes manimaculis TaxID=1843537 RepID=A0AAE1NVT7_9EUCA|nr:hypothetical protein Pmani_030531 [Petrolisthes manimaculis]